MHYDTLFRICGEGKSLSHLYIALEDSERGNSLRLKKFFLEMSRDFCGGAGGDEGAGVGGTRQTIDA